VGIQSCPSCGNNHFLYNGTSKVCTKCGAVYPDDFADLPTEPVQSVQNHEYDIYFVLGIALTIVALIVSLVSFLDARLLLVSLGFFVLATIPLIVFRIWNTVRSSQIYANFLLCFSVVNIIICILRYAVLKV
jgi:heme/copper-type cytochrome/quinol oxidase subunit 4